jgi:hypothetical protein
MKSPKTKRNARDSYPNTESFTLLNPVFRRRRQQRPQDQNEDQPWLVLRFLTQVLVKRVVNGTICMWCRELRVDRWFPSRMWCLETCGHLQLHL